MTVVGQFIKRCQEFALRVASQVFGHFSKTLDETPVILAGSKLYRCHSLNPKSHLSVEIADFCGNHPQSGIGDTAARSDELERSANMRGL
jgi:hypothetical protein